MSFIPGPWEVVCQQSNVLVESPEWIIADVWPLEATSTTFKKTQMANAHLIAAAPDLLAACKAVLWNVEHTDVGKYTVDNNGRTVEQVLREAITKAEGAESRND
ncbi:MAG: hypothetical protein LLG06_01840 [Desulfobacteraceae bacterium]|nr:hypothetical protein [Desulfobacteraceae bacterium]